MKRLLLLIPLFLLLCVPIHAQTSQPPDCVIVPTIITVANRSTPFDNRAQGCTSWTIYYFGNNLSTVSVELDSAPDNIGTPGTWAIWAGSTGSGSLPMTSTAENSATVGGFFPWVSVNVTTLTGGGNVTYAAFGYRPRLTAVGGGGFSSAGGSNCNGAAAGSSPSGNPCLIAGQNNNTGFVANICVNSSSASPGQIICNADVGADGDGNSNANVGFVLGGSNNIGTLANDNHQFNGTSWDRTNKCPTVVPITNGAAGTLQIVAPSSGKKVYVCSIVLVESTAGTMQLTEGTGATCATGSTNVSGAMTGIQGGPIGVAAGQSVFQTNVAGDGLCLVNGAATVSAGFASIAQY